MAAEGPPPKPGVSAAEQPRKNPIKPRDGDASKRLVAKLRSASETTSLALRNVAPAAGKTGFENVETYRLYCLDGVDKVASAEWIEAENDEAAIAAADEVRAGRSCELWQGNRLVARVGAGK